MQSFFRSAFSVRMTSLDCLPGLQSMRSEDNQIIERLLQGDAQAFPELLKRWQQRIVHFLYRHTGNLDDAVELAQETFQTVHQRIGYLKDRDSFSSWLYKIALNHSRMRMRKNRHREVEFLDTSADENGEPPDHYRSLAEPGAFSPEEQFSRVEMEGVVRQALERLEPRQREVILLKEYQGLKFAEIAQILDTPVSTVKSRMYLGLENLKKEILKIVKP